MKNQIKHLLIALACTGLMAMSATGQTFTTLYSFTAPSYSEGIGDTNNDGIEPYSGLVLAGNTLYGTATFGGNWAAGTVFAVNTDGTGFTTLHTFTTINYDNDSAVDASTNSDGIDPWAGLVLGGNTLYGTAEQGGTDGQGTVFAVNTNGTGFTTLHSFTALHYNSGIDSYINSDGAEPFYAGLILAGNTLYGTASQGGASGHGTVFAVNTDGTGFTVLHNFAGYPNDGGSPQAGLVLGGNTLYGTTYNGGSSAYGTVFAVNTDGTDFTILHSFSAVNWDSDIGNSTNSDGVNPNAGLVLAGNTLYGTAYEGGAYGNGTVFAVNTNGTGFTTLHSFTAYYYNSGIESYTNSDGFYPLAGLVLTGNTLYGVADGGGSGGSGTVFAVNTDGTGFTVLHTFTTINLNYLSNASTNADGSDPRAGLILSGNTLYGTAFAGGTWAEGTVFSLTLGSVSTPQPKLTIIRSGTNVTVTWPTNTTGYTLQSTTNMVSPAVWTTNSPAPVFVDTNNVVTNTICGTQQFFRLANP